MQYKNLTKEEINRELFSDFKRHQVVEQCMRKIEGKWQVVNDSFIDDWNEEDYKELIASLKATLNAGGMVIGAFLEEKLFGFTSASGTTFGKNNEYLDLLELYVSEDVRGMGIGKKLFEEVLIWADVHGAKKLYISAHSAVESQAFYRKMGCVEAKEYSKVHVEKEPCDCQLECLVKNL